MDSSLPAYQVQFGDMPLAVYREVAAHLAQVTGVTTDLLPPASERPFAYTHSQVGSLQLHYDATATPDSYARVEQILAYYGQRYGFWLLHSGAAVADAASDDSGQS
ncbi:hypothetical protein [Trichothermofontia sp.]